MSNLNDLEIEASITLNMEFCANSIELLCADYLIAPPKGIYSSSQVEPVMVDGVEYYTLVKKGDTFVRHPVADLYKVKKGQSVYTSKNDKDVLVVSSMQLSNKEKHLSNLPIRPYRGMKIVNLLINNQINSFIKYRKGYKDLYASIQNQFKEGLDASELEYVNGVIKEQYSETHQTLREFMGRFDWSIYFVKVRGYTVTVQRSMDWRAYDWTCRMESGEWKNAQSQSF